MKNDIRAIFIDSEGTLKDQDNKISKETILTIEELKQQGIYIVVTTGLPRFIARKISLSSHASPYVIASNGADIYDLRNNRELESTYLDKEVVDDILKASNDFNFILGVGDQEYCNHYNSYCKNGIIFEDKRMIDDKKFFQCHISQRDKISSYKEAIKEIKDFIIKYGINSLKELTGDNYLNVFINNEIDFINNPKIIEVLYRAVRFIKLREYRESLLSKHQDKIKIGNQSINFTNYSHDGEIPWFSLNDNSISKGEGIRKFCQRMDIPLSKTMGIGNDYNDLSMVEYVSLFTCPSDSHELVLDKASITFDRTKDGISKLLRKVYN